jgi:DNA modification methylase
MKPIKIELERRLRHCKRVLIPFAGQYRFEIPGIEFVYMDMADDLPVPYLKGNCLDLIPSLDETFDAVIADPPYSMFQAVHSYKLEDGPKRMQDITRLKQLVEPLINSNGYYIQFGYNSTGMRADQGFTKEKLLVINLGGSHNDFLMLIQRKTPVKTLTELIK